MPLRRYDRVPEKTVGNPMVHMQTVVPPYDWKASLAPKVTVAHSELVLNEDDPFEAVLAEMVRMFRKKNADYARTGSRWSNFEDMSRFLGDESKPWLSALVLCQQKLSRIGALVSSGKEPTNESLLDSLLDNAVYAAMALAMAKEQA